MKGVILIRKIPYKYSIGDNYIGGNILWEQKN